MQALGIPCYDEALGIPTEESQTLSIRTQQVIAEESGVCNTVDPLGGSYCVEWLTRKVEKEVSEYIQRIENMGDDGTVLCGLIEGTKSGVLVEEISEEAIRRKKEIESGKITMIGLNKYREEETLSPPVFRPDPEIAKMKIRKLREFKKRRDNQKVRKALSELKEVTESGGNVMPVLVRTARARVTLEEAMDVFRTCFKDNVE
ncbi:MAG: hypothetical protein JRJ83_18105 [Deltaproteobacteria bacterium]|nr:hypothetical protein [Deltaproteobacteria bacterium]